MACPHVLRSHMSTPSPSKRPSRGSTRSSIPLSPSGPAMGVLQALQMVVHHRRRLFVDHQHSRPSDPGYIGDSVEMLRDRSPDEPGRLESALRVSSTQVSRSWCSPWGGYCACLQPDPHLNAGRYIEFDVRNELYAKARELSRPLLRRMDRRYHQPLGQRRHVYPLLFAISFLHVINTAVAYSIAMSRMASSTGN